MKLTAQQQYVLNCIPDSEEIRKYYGVDTTTDGDRVKFVLDTFSSEYSNEYNRKRWPNDQDRITQWLRGVPSVINISVDYDDIANWLIVWGVLPENYTEKQYYKHVNNWFSVIAYRLLQLDSKLNKKL